MRVSDARIICYFTTNLVIMEDLKEKTADLFDHVEDFAQTYKKLALIKVTEKATNALSFAMVIVAFLLLGLFAVAFLGVALCWWLGDLVQSRALGFVLGGGVFMLLFLIVALLRKNIVYPMIRDSILKKVYD